MTSDLDWIESLAKPLPAAPGGDRGGRPSRTTSRSSIATPAASSRCCAGSHRRIVEVGTAYGYSTLWMALGQPADGTIVTIDPDRERTDLARGWWREAGIADERITVVNAPALEAIAADDPALAGPFDMVFIDALKPEYEAYLDALGDRLVPGRARRRRQRPVERPGVGSRPAAADDANTAALRGVRRGGPRAIRG